MSRYYPFSVLALLLVSALIWWKPMPGQVPEHTGQDVVPVFEGWEQNPDGTYEMYFGYMNRNFSEELNIPVGPNNKFEPGDPDRGQPGFFYPRRQMFLFHVQVPKDWGQKDLTWTLTSHGRTEKAFGHLQPVWLIDNRLIAANVHGSSNLDVVDNDQPPVVKIEPVQAVTYPEPATLKVSVSDDGNPKPGQRRPRPPQENAATFLNAPLPVQPRWPAGLNVTWIEFRGPGKATFNPAGYQPVVAGKENVTSVTFSEPGTYVLQAVASDSALETRENITITVAAPASHTGSN
ncbi:MAG TPA: hypothetical protein VEV17_24850 [Bryobacteraceae bacterium]|nr:hypothetical protein [Bryobacteraceae bacterium]